MEAWHSLLKARNGKNPYNQLSSLLSRFRRFEATLPADKLFALYGLAQADVAKLELQPNYAGPVEEVYVESTFAILQRLEDTTVLEVPRGRSDLRKTLPSWVPDWSDTSRLAGGGLTPESRRERYLICSKTETPQGSDDEGDSGCDPVDSASSKGRGSSETPSMSEFFQHFHVSHGSPLPGISKDAKIALTLQGFLFDGLHQLSNTLSELTLMEWPDETSRWARNNVGNMESVSNSDISVKPLQLHTTILEFSRIGMRF